MITKVQGKAVGNSAAIVTRPKLTAMERGMLTWAILDPGDKVLDANTREGLMLEYLYRNMECEICGMSSQMEYVKQSRSRLQNADIVYASTEDIPWKENAFDVVMLRKGQLEAAHWNKTLKEALRVLKPGGQFLASAICYPTPIRQMAHLWEADTMEPRKELDSKTSLLKSLEEAGYQQLSWQQVDLATGVVIGWKP